MFNGVLCKTKLDQLCSRILLLTYIIPELEVKISQLEEYWTIPTNEVISTKGGGLNKWGRVNSFVEILYLEGVLIKQNIWWSSPKN